MLGSPRPVRVETEEVRGLKSAAYEVVVVPVYKNVREPFNLVEILFHHV